jgi:hypothetical protein
VNHATRKFHNPGESKHRRVGIRGAQRSSQGHTSGVGSGLVHLKCAVKFVPSWIETADTQRYRQELLESVALFAQPKARWRPATSRNCGAHGCEEAAACRAKGARGQVDHKARQGEPPDHQPDGEESGHRSDPTTMEQWHDQAGGGRFGSCLDQADRRFWWWTACKPESSENSGVPPRALGAADRQSRPRFFHHPSTAGATSVLGAREAFPDKDAWPPEEQSLSV